MKLPAWLGIKNRKRDGGRIMSKLEARNCARMVVIADESGLATVAEKPGT